MEAGPNNDKITRIPQIDEAVDFTCRQEVIVNCLVFALYPGGTPLPERKVKIRILDKSILYVRGYKIKEIIGNPLIEAVVKKEIQKSKSAINQNLGTAVSASWIAYFYMKHGAEAIKSRATIQAQTPSKIENNIPEITIGTSFIILFLIINFLVRLNNKNLDVIGNNTALLKRINRFKKQQ
jgi:predicted transcriptional regulator